MKIDELKTWAPQSLGVLRIVTGLIFFEHGSQKLFGLPPRPLGASYPALLSLSGTAGIIEACLGPFIIFGLFTRQVAFLLAGEMAVAYWISHFPRNFFPVTNGGDAAILYCFVFLYLMFAGAGAWSLDRLWRGKD